MITNNPIKMDSLNRHLTSEDTYMGNKHMKRCSTSCVIREMPTKTKTRYAFSPGGTFKD